jgi:hypothetical protein
VEMTMGQREACLNLSTFLSLEEVNTERTALCFICTVIIYFHEDEGPHPPRTSLWLVTIPRGNSQRT